MIVEQDVSVLFSEPKIPQSCARIGRNVAYCVSVLFSEPKIPQSCGHPTAIAKNECFSALQRAENSSIDALVVHPEPGITFQCSSASRKFLNLSCVKGRLTMTLCFSALQRAENSSIWIEHMQPSKLYSFSALQRAENSSIIITDAIVQPINRFSALQRAENSSIGCNTVVAQAF